MVTKGFDENRLRDMDHVSLVAMYDELTRQESLDAASHVALSATAAQGTQTSVKKTIDDLTRRGGVRPKSDDFKDLLK